MGTEPSPMEKETEGPPPPKEPERVSGRSAGLHSSVLTAEVLDKQTEICRSMVDINNSLLAINETLKLINGNLKNKYICSLYLDLRLVFNQKINLLLTL